MENTFETLIDKMIAERYNGMSLTPIERDAYFGMVLDSFKKSTRGEVIIELCARIDKMKEEMKRVQEIDRKTIEFLSQRISELTKEYPTDSTDNYAAELEKILKEAK